MTTALSTVWPTRQVRATAAAFGLLALTLVMGIVVRHAEWTERFDERVAKGRKPQLEDYILESQWHAALLSALLCVGLAVTARYWVSVPAAGGASVARVGGASRRWFWPVVCLLVVVGAWVRAPRMSHSLYNDEAYAFRRYVAGEHKQMPDGTKEWRPVPWLGTLWGNQMANNGVPYSLVSRAAYDVTVARGWAAATLPAEVPLRLPALVAGLGSVVAVALLARRLGGPLAGTMAGLLAAVHPWHVRFSTEARGHSFVLLFAPLLPLVLARAVETGRWRWWAVFGAVEVMLLWSFAGALHYLLAFNFVALIWLWRRGGGGWRQCAAVHIMAGMVYVHLMAPCFPQMHAALSQIPVFSSGLRGTWWATTASFLVAGMPWRNANPEIVDHPSLRQLWIDHPVAVSMVLLAGAAVVVAGVKRAWSDPIGRVIALSLPLAAGLAITASLVGRTVLFTWYVLYLLPGGLVLAGLGLAALLEAGWRRGRRGAWIGVSAAVVLLAAWAWMIHNPLVTYRRMGKQALREVAVFVQTPVDGVVPLAALHRSEAVAYDPSLLSLKDDLSELRALADRADAEGRPLVVAIGYRPLVAKHSPAFLAAIEESGEFEHVAHFPGLEEPQFAHHIWRRRARARQDN